MSQSSHSSEDRETPRRRFLKQVALPAAVLAATLPLAAALEAAEEKSGKETAPEPKPKPPADGKKAQPFPATVPDVSVAKTAAERKTLEEQWKQMNDTLEAIRKAKVPDTVPPAFTFKALKP